MRGFTHFVIFIIPVAYLHALEAVEQRNLFTSLPTDVTLKRFLPHARKITEILFPTEQWSLLRKCTLLFFLFKRVFRYYTYMYTRIRAMFRAQDGRMWRIR